MYTIKFAFKSGKIFEIKGCATNDIKRVKDSKLGERIILNCGIIETSQIEFVSWELE